MAHAFSTHSLVTTLLTAGLMTAGGGALAAGPCST